MIPTFPSSPVSVSGIARVSNIVYPVTIIIMKLSVNPSLQPPSGSRETRVIIKSPTMLPAFSISFVSHSIRI